MISSVSDCGWTHPFWKDFVSQIDDAPRRIQHANGGLLFADFCRDYNGAMPPQGSGTLTGEYARDIIYTETLKSTLFPGNRHVAQINA
jgi:hypothetical protein